MVEMGGGRPPIQEDNTSQGGGNNGKWKSKIAMIENKAKKQKRQLSVFNTKAKYGLDNEESY